MDLTALLEIVISLSAMFWLLSLISSFIVEAGNSLFRNVRADALERFVCEMILGDGKIRLLFKQFRGKLAGRPDSDPLNVLGHSLVESLRKPSKSASSEADAPSYIPKEVFAKVILDRLAALAVGMGQAVADCIPLVTGLAATTANPTWKALLDECGISVQPKSGNLPAAVARILLTIKALEPARAIADLNDLEATLNAQLALKGAGALPSALRPVATQLRSIVIALAKAHTQAGGTKTPSDLELLRALMNLGRSHVQVDVFAAVEAVVEHGPLPDTLREALRPIVANANHDLGLLRKGLEDWFDSVMERATGWFKRNTTLLLGVCGGVLAISFNINPILMTRDLVEDPALRRAGVSFANQIVEQQGDSGLARRYYFAIQSDRQHWKGTIDKLIADEWTTESGPKLYSLAHQMQSALLTSGQYVGLLPDVRNPAGPGAKWTTTQRDQFLLRVCVAWHEAQRTGASDRTSAKPPESIQDCKRLALDFGVVSAKPEVSTARTVTKTTVTDESSEPKKSESVTRSSSSRTEEISTTTERSNLPGAIAASAPAPSGSAAQPNAKSLSEAPAQPQPASPTAIETAKDADLAKFWSSSDIVWDRRLGAALWAVLVAAHPDATDATDRLKKLKELGSAFDDTNRQADESTKYVNAFINRIPSLGWRPDPRLSFLDNASLITGKVLWGLLGWPLTALMVSFGAAFWFDLLSKLSNRRVTGPRPDTTTS